MATILGIILGLVLAALVIWVVSKLNLGLTVDGFVSAIIAAAVIVIIGAAIAWVLSLLGITIGGGLLGAIINLIIAAIVLLLAGRILPGLKVAGFGGALIAAIAIGVVTWLATWVIGLFI